MNLQLLDGYAAAFLLHVVRVGSFFAVNPLFGQQTDSLMLRLVLALGLGGMFWWVGDQQIDVPANLLALGVLALREAVIGIALGFSMSMLTSMLVTAGEIISSEMGFSLARTMNPESGTDATVISQLLQVFGFLLILHFDLHHDVLRIVEQTFRSCRVGQPFDIEPIWLGLRELVGGSVRLAVQYSLPVLAIMFLLSVGMVLLGRAVPAINLMEFGFALRVIAALAVMAFFLVEGSPFLIQTFTALIERAANMFPV